MAMKQDIKMPTTYPIANNRELLVWKKTIAIFNKEDARHVYQYLVPGLDVWCINNGKAKLIDNLWGAEAFFELEQNE